MAVERGQTNCLQVLLDAQGDENGLTFSLQFDTNLLSYVSARLAGSASAASLFIRNTNQLAQGRVGLFVGLDPDQSLPAGLQPVIEVCFRAASVTNPVATAVTIVEQPIPMVVADAQANELPAVSRDGMVVITSGNAFVFEAVSMINGGQVNLNLLGALGVWELQASMDLEHWEKIATLSNTTGQLQYIDLGATNLNHRFYRALKP
jgi:hypothetical protein